MGSGSAGKCGAPLAAGCAACGAENPPGHRFCGACGNALASVASTTAAAPPAGTPLAERRLVDAWLDGVLDPVLDAAPAQGGG